jgi:hypothetical protein
MSASPSPSARTLLPSLWRSRTCRLLVGSGAAAALIVMGAPVASAAGTAATGPTSAAGNLLDATIGGSPIDQLAELKYALAIAPGKEAVNDPLDVTALGALHLPLTGVIDLPTSPVANAGVVGQYAKAAESGTATGAAGAITNTGGVNLNTSEPNGEPLASVHLSAGDLSGILGAGNIPGLDSIPGLGSLLPALPGGADLNGIGSVDLELGAVSARAASTDGTVAKPVYKIASVKLEVGSPLLGSILGQVVGAGGALGGGTGALSGLIAPVTGALAPIKTLLDGLTLTPPALNTALAECDVTAFLAGALPSTLSLEGGAVVLDPATGDLTVDVQKLLEQLDLDLNALPANTDLLAYVLGDLPSILNNAVQGLLNGLLDPLIQKFNGCTDAINAAATALGPLSSTVGGLLTTLTGAITTLVGAKTTIETQIDNFVDQIGGTWTDGIGVLSDGLAQLVDVGVNVQSGPGASATNPKYPYESGLAATVKQGDPALAGDQTLVRAIEIKVAGASSGGLGALSGALPVLPSLPAGIVAPLAAPVAAAPGDGLIVLALANAAVAPGVPAAAPTTSPAGSSPAGTAAPTATTPDTDSPTVDAQNAVVPTGVDAGKGISGSPLVPVVLLLVGLVMAGAGAFSWKFRMGRRGA